MYQLEPVPASVLARRLVFLSWCVLSLPNIPRIIVLTRALIRDVVEFALEFLILESDLIPLELEIATALQAEDESAITA